MRKIYFISVVLLCIITVHSKGYHRTDLSSLGVIFFQEDDTTKTESKESPAASTPEVTDKIGTSTEDPNKEKSDEGKKDPTNEKLDQIIKILESDTAKDKEKLGELRLISKTVVIHNLGDNPRIQLKKNSQQLPYDSIKEILVKIENGAIYDIRVETDSGLIFVNRKDLPPLLNWEKRLKKYKLNLGSVSYQYADKSAFIYIEDFLDYKSLKRFKMDDLLEPVTLTKKDSIVPVFSGKKLEHLINFRIYTDLLALVNENPNGLVQFEGDANFYINLIPCRRFYIFNYLKPFLNLSKYDTQIKNVQISDSSYSPKTHIDFLQKSNVYSGAILNFISYVSKDGNTNFDLNLGGSYFLAPYQIDTIVQENSLQGIGYFATAKIITKRISNFIFDYGFTVMATKPYKIDDINYHNWYWTKMVTGEIRYIVDSKNEIFLRARYVGDGKNAFNQIQVGYKSQIPIPKAKK